MTETITEMIDELVDAIEEENTERSRELVDLIGDEYDSMSSQEQKTIRQATILRGGENLTEEEREQLSEVVSASADIEAKRGTFILQALTTITSLEEGAEPDDEFDEAASAQKEAEVNFKEKEAVGSSIVGEFEIPASIEILNMNLGSSRIYLTETTRLNTILSNIGDTDAESIEIKFKIADELFISSEAETLDDFSGGEERTESYEIGGKDVGDYRIRAEVSSENAGTDIDSTSIVIEPVEVKWQPPVADQDDSHNINQTLPIKFKLWNPDDGLIEEEQDVYLTVYGPSTDDDIGDEIASWELGDGSDRLRFDEDEAEYIANFQMREYDLEDDETYSAIVQSTHTDLDLGKITFEVEERGGGRGNR